MWSSEYVVQALSNGGLSSLWKEKVILLVLFCFPSFCWLFSFWECWSSITRWVTFTCCIFFAYPGQIPRVITFLSFCRVCLHSRRCNCCCSSSWYLLGCRPDGCTLIWDGEFFMKANLDVDEAGGLCYGWIPGGALHRACVGKFGSSLVCTGGNWK